MAKARKINQKVIIPKHDPTAESLSSADARTPKTPKTPADEGLDFFEAALKDGEPAIRVYELRLDPDGGPNKERAVRTQSSHDAILADSSRLCVQYMRLPPAYVPYIVRVSLDAGTPASKNGVFKTNFPLDGGRFDRHQFAERK